MSAAAALLAASGVIALSATLAWTWSHRRPPQRDAPTVGVGSGIAGTLIASFQSVTKMHAWIEAGHHLRTTATFRVRWVHKWMTVVSSPECLEELISAREDVLSAKEAMIEALSLDYTIGPAWREESPIHLTLVRSRLTRSLDRLFAAALDELQLAFQDELDPFVGDADEWSTIAAMEPMTRIICRTSNRLFVGEPLCRNEEFTRLNVKFTADVVTSAAMLMWPIPTYAKRFIATWLSPVQRAVTTATRLLSPLIEERRQLSPGAERPDDMLQWILDSKDKRAKETPQVVARLLNLNFSSIYTTANVFVFTLHRLASENRYVKTIRQEVTEALAAEGWTKAAMDRLPMLDSFLRECARFHDLSAVSVLRKAMRDYTFADGTVVPRDTILGAPSHALHLDTASDPTATTFDGFRFIGQSYADGTRKTLIATGQDYIPFGHGKHACPGRFWAENEMKMMVAHLLMHFDVRLAGAAGVLPDRWFCFGASPNAATRIQLRRRTDHPRREL